MPPVVADALSILRDLGTFDELWAEARRGLAPVVRPKVNGHIHLPPNFSAFQSVRQAVELAATQGVRVIGLSNYYDYDVYAEFAGLARERGLFPLYGLEIICLLDDLVRAGVKINDPGNPGKMYICGKGITRFVDRAEGQGPRAKGQDQNDGVMTDEARAIIGVIRRNDQQRMAQMVAKLAAVFAARGVPLGLDEDAVIDMVVRRHGCPRGQVYLQERHVCQAFQEALFAQVPAEQRLAKLAQVFGAAPKAGPGDVVKIQNEIRAQLMKAGKPAFVDETFIRFPEAYRLILALGGIPCYPTLADGTSPVCPYEDPVEQLIERIVASQVYAAEFIPIRNQPDVLARYVTPMRRAGLVVTAGTEHNTLDLLPIEPLCVGGQAVPEAVREIFWEGACVVAAHQFLTLHGQCGFVDRQGAPNPAYPGTEARIAAFRQLGAAVIQRYYDAK